MKYPCIDVDSPYTQDQFLNWMHSHEQDAKERRSTVKAAFFPPAKAAQLSDLNLYALSQLTGTSYSCVLVIGNLADTTEQNGICLPEQDIESFDTLFRKIDVRIPQQIARKIKSIKYHDQLIHYKALSLLEHPEIGYSLPIIAEKTPMIPVIPLLYKKCDPSLLAKIINIFYNFNTLIIIIGMMSHSLSIIEAKSMDSSTISKIIALDDSVSHLQSNAYVALNCLLQLCDTRFLRPKVLTYQIIESDQQYINKSGCASIVFYK